MVRASLPSWSLLSRGGSSVGVSLASLSPLTLSAPAKGSRLTCLMFWGEHMGMPA